MNRSTLPAPQVGQWCDANATWASSPNSSIASAMYRD
jgi:hypothetical protein